jgi:predicted deacetylase
MVIPKFGDGSSIQENAAFLDWLRVCCQQGHEIWAHGLTHCATVESTGFTSWRLRSFINRHFTGCESEFLGLSRAEKRSRLQASLEIFSGCGIPIKGFTPPTWWGAVEADVLRDNHLQFQDLRFGIQDARAKTFHFSLPLVWPASPRPKSALGGAAYLRWLALAPTIRFALHPHDEMHPDFWPTLESLGQGRELCLADDLQDRKKGGGEAE